MIHLAHDIESQQEAHHIQLCFLEQESTEAHHLLSRIVCNIQSAARQIYHRQELPSQQVDRLGLSHIVQTETDINKQRQLQQAWNGGATVDQMLQLNQQLGLRPFTADELAVMRSQFEKKGPINFYVEPTGESTVIQGAAGAALETPVGEGLGAYTAGAANTLLLGGLDELAPVLGLSPQQVQAGKEYLRQQAPVSSFLGQVTGSSLAAIPAIKGSQALLGGTRLASAAPLIGETTLGAATGAGEAKPGDRLLGALIEGGTAGLAGAAVNRFMPGGPGTFGGGPPDITPTVGGTPPAGMGGPRGSVGAMSLDEATIRAERAAELPVPIELARFQRTRNFVEQQRARELAKNNEVGGPIRDRMAQQQEALRQNFESFVDGTGSEVWNNPYEQGGVIANALSTLAKRERTRINALYKRAEKAGEMREPVSYAQLTDFINQQTPTTREKLAPVLKSVEEQLLANDPDKTGMITLNQMEDIRKLINKVAKPGTPDSAFGRDMRGIIDDATKDSGGDVYRQARQARSKYARDFEDIDLVQKIFDNKPGTTERYVALEKVVDRITGQSAPLDSVTHLLGLLDRAGPRGERAKRELQGALMEKIRDQACRGITKDESGAVVIQPSALNTIITSLDKGGKLDAIFDKKTAELLRTVNSVAQDIVTAPPGSINASGTSSAILNAADTLATFGTTGIPVPAARVLNELRKALQNREMRKEVKRLLD